MTKRTHFDRHPELVEGCGRFCPGSVGAPPLGVGSKHTKPTAHITGWIPAFAGMTEDGFPPSMERQKDGFLPPQERQGRIQERQESVE